MKKRVMDLKVSFENEKIFYELYKNIFEKNRTLIKNQHKISTFIKFHVENYFFKIIFHLCNYNNFWR